MCLPGGAQRFEELLAQMAADDGERRYVLAELNDLLTGLGRDELSETVARAELWALSP